MKPSPLGQQKGRRRFIPVAALLLCAVLFSALGVWQVNRLAWKRALIAHVDQVSTANPVEARWLPMAPSPRDLADLEYRHVWALGRFEPQGTTLVSALTERGAGYWVLAPLRMSNGRAVWINRGYVPLGSTALAEAARTPMGEVAITGLLRKTEPKGRFLQANAPAQDRWYVRDIAVISATRGVKGAAAWFIDAQGPEIPGAPIPGLTVVQFPNSHLQYALTWFAMALLSLFAIRLVWRRAA
jgi:surfeit locus 1 family protein